MPILIAGFVVTDAKKLREHVGHELMATDTDRLSLDCLTCSANIVVEPDPPTPTYDCGWCESELDHKRDANLQLKYKREWNLPASTCFGCYSGDDGGSMHDCALHRI